MSPTPCPSCNGENSPDSRFCRHCGVALDAPAADNAAAEQNSSSPAEIDARRARQLLDRAVDLSERGDKPGAFLACRQSISLAPSAPGGYALLGLFLERGGDLRHAVSAYEKAVELAPDSIAERESLARLREKVQSQANSGSQSAAMFHFDEDELFEGTTLAPSETKREVSQTPAETTAPTAVTSADPVAAESAAPPAATDSLASDSSEDAHPVLNISAAAPGLPAAMLDGDTQSSTPAPASRDAAQSAPRIAAALPPSLPSAPPSPVGFRAPATPAKVAPLSFDEAETPRSPWTRFWGNPSFYGRSLPLLATTVLALGFLSWARNVAVARAAANAPLVQIPAVSNSPEVVSEGDAPVANAVDSGIVANTAVAANTSTVPAEAGGFPITNGTPVAPTSPAVASTTAPSTTAPVPGAPSASASGVQPVRSGSAPVRSAPAPRNSATNTAPRRVVPQPLFPRPLPPAPIPAAPSGASAPSEGSSGSSAPSGTRNPPLILPAPDLGPSETAAPPVSVLPSGGGTALNPAGASNRGYVRITQGQVGRSTPARSSARGNSDENTAASASRNGQADQAINRLTAAINASPGDAGLRYQQRANLFLERGDSARAAADFQAAIAAFTAQIERGEEVAAARAGLRSARSGLNVALATAR